ncbi:50S ribosomal protein L3 N(5)-glutamine methyltransferase [Thioflexithrix psekupsensis]|uniref:50S ribosomal protein L3 N(5)-glutamine methyltransferase n=1 Tax=Thioflexithrix psekupsensis TaxID=1570016 RepID=UPI0015949651|nr:50S ribosomal protein L3 N(5)-glutamine methyltransferase [Thioflexithrix psekupsensis]
MDSSAIDELHTIADFVRWAASRFNEAHLYFGHGTDNAVDEAVALVLQTLHLGQELPPLLWQGRLTYREKTQLLNQLQLRLEKRIPVPYLTQQAWFAQLPFYVDQRVLIPRSPIAELIEARYAPWLEIEQVNRVLDLCCGSGCIGIATAIKSFPEAEVDLVDISPDALAVAQKNIDEYQLNDKVHIVQSDLFTELAGIHYDLIVTNPPYVDAQALEEMPEEYHHEPVLGLAAGEDGLSFAHQILAQAKRHLTPHGILVVEVGASAPALIAAYPDLPFLWLEFARGGEGVFLLTYDQLPD